VRLFVGAAQVDRHHQRVAGRALKLVSSFCRAAEDGDGQLTALAAVVAVAADDGHAVAARGCGHARAAPRAAPCRAPRLHSASTTAIGRPPIAQMSLTLTITPQ
jgi:hypothetical protein